MVNRGQRQGRRGASAGTSTSGGAGSATKEAAEQVQQKAGQVLDQAQQQAGQLKEQVQQKAGPALDQTQQKADQVKGQVQHRATSRLESQKEQAAGGLGSAAQAFRQLGQQLREQDQGAVARYSDQAAEKIEQAQGYLSSRNVGQLVGDVEDFARREPALFLGGAFALGLLGARFLKSSGQATHQGHQGQQRAY